jgi:hypothetical protein
VMIIAALSTATADLYVTVMCPTCQVFVMSIRRS